MKHSLAPKGLSLSQAQSISNLCNQRARDINFKLADINSAVALGQWKKLEKRIDPFASVNSFAAIISESFTIAIQGFPKIVLTGALVTQTSSS